MFWQIWDRKSIFGWEIDHIFPKSILRTRIAWRRDRPDRKPTPAQLGKQWFERNGLPLLSCPFDIWKWQEQGVWWRNGGQSGRTDHDWQSVRQIPETKREIDTFVQLFAAFYVTLSVENQILRHFWPPAYYKTIVNLIPKYGFRYSTRFQRQFSKKIQELSRGLETESRKKGTCMLLVCIVLLGYSIFQPDSFGLLVAHCMMLIVYVILALEGIFCSHHWFKCWRAVAIHGTLSLLAAIGIGYIYRKWICPIDINVIKACW